jgi:hypothetical protein
LNRTPASPKAKQDCAPEELAYIRVRDPESAPLLTGTGAIAELSPSVIGSVRMSEKPNGLMSPLVNVKLKV